ncbi:hypothetical protein IWX90DRAFT_10028 [Phyllosticta citrichinensis]|uniref:Uncharacterized protein n=1 Tax=Phyllosticta citrichinensis TaxID=1130410 RepID=A0ABR1Y5Y6_9PEZI
MTAAMASGGGGKPPDKPNNNKSHYKSGRRQKFYATRCVRCREAKHCAWNKCARRCQFCHTFNHVGEFCRHPPSLAFYVRHAHVRLPPHLRSKAAQATFLKGPRTAPDQTRSYSDVATGRTTTPARSTSPAASAYNTEPGASMNDNTGLGGPSAGYEFVNETANVFSRARQLLSNTNAPPRPEPQNAQQTRNSRHQQRRSIQPRSYQQQGYHQPRSYHEPRNFPQALNDRYRPRHYQRSWNDQQPSIKKEDEEYIKKEEEDVKIKVEEADVKVKTEDLDD